jgi:hypothetical protein
MLLTMKKSEALFPSQEVSEDIKIKTQALLIGQRMHSQLQGSADHFGSFLDLAFSLGTHA